MRQQFSSSSLMASTLGVFMGRLSISIVDDYRPQNGREVLRGAVQRARGGTERVRPLPSMATNTNTASVTLRHSLDSGSSLHTSTIIWIELRPISRVWV